MSVKCGNRQVHGPKGGYHASAAEVRQCFATPTGGYGPVASVAPPAELPYSINVTQGTLHKGYFTVVFADGTRRTLRLRRQAKDASFRPGVMLVGLLTGSDNTGDYTSVGEVYERGGKAAKVKIWKKHRENRILTEAIRVLCGDPQAAAKAYAQESDRCSKCNHELTVPQGPKKDGFNPYRDAGYGPDCGDEVFGNAAA